MKLYQRIIAILFFIFFTCPLFSPSVFGLTLYLYYFMPLLDYEFDLTMLKNVRKLLKNIKLCVILCLILLLSVLFKHVVFALEILLLIYVVCYLVYIFKKGGFKYLYWFININIIIGIIQFISYYLFPEVLDVLNPTYIADFIWGPLATGTYNNLYPSTTSLVRVSGLSREAGFFASLIVVSFMCYNFTYEKKKKNLTYYIQNIFFVIGFVISFSKATLLVIPAYFVLKYRNALNLFKTSTIIILILALGIPFSNTLKIERYYDEYSSPLYETFAHRFGGYTLLGQIDLKTALVGTEHISDLDPIILNSNYFIKHILKFDTVSGVPSLFIQQGFIIAILFYLLLKKFHFKAAEVLFITIITITVNYTTQTSFVALSYFLCMYFLLREDKRKENKNILIVNELLWSGGAEVYTINLYKALKKENYNVKILTFDNNFDKNIKNIKDIKVQDFYNLKLHSKWQKIGRVIFQPILYLKLNIFLNRFQPNHILINNVFSCPTTFYTVINGYDNIQIVHDAGVVCPKSACIQNDGTVCKGYKFQNCMKTCTYHDSKMQLMIKLFQLRVLEYLRKKVIRLFISPSNWLKNYLQNFDYNAIQIANPITLSEDFSVPKNDHFLYVGTINENKGIFDFIKTVNDLKIKIELDIIGGCQYKEDELKLQEIIKNNAHIHYLGKKSNEKVQKYMQKSYCVIVPSKLFDNYPTTVLEAMGNKTLVIGSNVGGVAEIINDPLFLFDLSNVNSVEKTIKNVQTLSQKDYNEIVLKNYQKIIHNNQNTSFIEKITNLIE